MRTRTKITSWWRTTLGTLLLTPALLVTTVRKEGIFLTAGVHVRV